MIQVSHFIGLSGVGGVQRNFVEYINHQATPGSELSHKVYSLGRIDSQYKILAEVHDIKKLKNLLSLILDIISRNRIVHFYNNLTSLKVAILLLFLPVRNLIMHERGTIWNFPYSHRIFLQFIAWKAHLILANSNATKTMLEKRFNISNNKIRVIHNGINTDIKCTKKYLLKDSCLKFCIGFIGRLDTPKGVHVLIDAMKYLVNDKIELVIAGDGALSDILKEQAKGFKNISFVGRISEPYNFLSGLDLLVVPSIREPLGNVCLEAGLCKIPVLAANIDGIPEIIKDKLTGELIDATEEISIDSPAGAVPLPKFVISPVTKQLRVPKQINSLFLSEKILELSKKPDKLKKYANNLHDRVVNYFNMSRYHTELYKIYRKII
jgi:glycosyltransferase involved in cell wall biosynthesis